jgi:hypothetical protein
MMNTNTNHDRLDKGSLNLNIDQKAISCLTCGYPVIAEYNAELELITLYDFDPYYFDNQRILHSHPADIRTKNRGLERIRTEKRLLDDVDPNDYHYEVEKEFER